MDFSIFSSTALQWIIGIVLIGYVAYITYRSIQTYVQNKKLSEEFRNTHKEYDTYTFHMYMVYLMGCLSVLCLVLGFLTGSISQLTVPKDQVFYYRLAYVGLAIVFFGQIFESKIRRTILFTQEGMFYVDKYYRFRMITSYEEKQGSISRTSKVHVGSDELQLPHQMALEVQSREKAWKAAKKAAKKARK